MLDSENNVLNEWTSTKTENHVIEGLSTGVEYTLRETVAPEGYTIPTDCTFTIDEDGKVTSTGTVSEEGVLLVENSKTKVEVSVVDIANGEELEGATVQVLDSDGDIVEEWTSTKTENHVIEGLSTGIEYTLRETVAPEGYTIPTDCTFTIATDGTVISAGTVSEEGVLLVENSKTHVEVSVVDITNGDELAGGHVQVIEAKGTDDETIVEEWTSTTENHVIEGLSTGVEYTLHETVAPEGYALSSDYTFTIDEIGKITSAGNISEDGVLLVKNSLSINSSVSIIWDDNNNQDGIRPETLTATLSDGSEYSNTVTLSADNEWKVTVEDLPKYDNGGNEITYTWTQGELPEGYALTNTSTEGIVTTITNSHTPEETTVKVSKVWNDNNNKGGLRTESVTVNLMKGETVVESVELGADNEWTYTWMQLPKYENGNAIDYTVTEDPVANYLTEITKATDGTFTYTVTNTLQVNVTITEGTGSTDPLSFSGTITDLDYSRTLTAPGTDDGDITIDNEPANLYTVCLPFTPKTEDGMTYYTLSGVNSGVNGTTLSFTEVSTTDLAAFTPYVAAVKGNNDITESCSDVTFDTDEGIQSTTVNGFTFTGTLTGLTNAQAAEAAGDGSVTYILQSGGNWGQVPANTSGVFIPPFRAYITGPKLSPSGARQMNSSFIGEETGIDSIRLVDKDGTERWYDLNGRRIDRPTRDGIYIQNGKKVVVK